MRLPIQTHDPKMKRRFSTPALLAACGWFAITTAMADCPMGKTPEDAFKNGWAHTALTNPSFPFGQTQVFEKNGVKVSVDPIEGKIARLLLEANSLIPKADWESARRSWLNAVFSGIKDEDIKAVEGGYSCSYGDRRYFVHVEESDHGPRMSGTFRIGDAEYFASPADVAQGVVKPEKMHLLRAALFN